MSVYVRYGVPRQPAQTFPRSRPVGPAASSAPTQQEASGTAAVTVAAAAAATAQTAAIGSSAVVLAAAGAATARSEASGSSAVTLAATGAATTVAQASGSSPVTIAAAGAATARTEAAGSSTVTLTAAAAGTAATSASGTAPVTVAAAAAGTARTETSGSSAVTVLATGSATARAQASGTSPVTVTASGSATARTLASGAAAVTVTATGTAYAPDTSGSYPQAILGDTASRYLRLGDPAGNVALDSSGNGQHGTYLNSPTLGTTGAIGGDSDTGITLNGTSQAVTVPCPAVSAAAFDWAYEAWVNMAAGVDGLKNTFILTETSSTDSNPIVGISIDGTLDGRLRGYFRESSAGGIKSVTYATSLRDSAWHHVVWSCDSTSMVARLYVDGVSRGTVSLTGQSLPVVDRAAIGALDRVGALGSYYKGGLDEAAIYPHSLSAAAVLQHYQAGTGSAGQQEASGTSTITIAASGAATARAEASGTAAVTVASSAAATAQTAATGTSPVTLAATGAATARTAAAGTAAVTITAAGSATVRLETAGAGAIVVAAAGSATARTEATGAGAVTIIATGTATVPAGAAVAVIIRELNKPLNLAAATLIDRGGTVTLSARAASVALIDRAATVTLIDRNATVTVTTRAATVAAPGRRVASVVNTDRGAG